MFNGHRTLAAEKKLRQGKRILKESTSELKLERLRIKSLVCYKAHG